MKENGDQSPASISISILGNGGKGNPKSLYVFTDNHRYLFNCGEGTQRLANEHSMKLMKMENVFITNTNWTNCGGLPGLSMTLQNSGWNKLRVHGPSDLVELYQMTKIFGITADMNVEQHDYEKGNFRDSCMEVERIALSRFNEIGDSATKKQKVVGDVFCYLCTFHDKKGELLIQKCIELKVPRGPLLGQLKAGVDVTLPDGRKVSAKDVVGPCEKGPLLLVIDCPSFSYVKSLCDITKPWQQKFKDSNAPKVVVHFTSTLVTKTEDYQQLISSFPEETTHLFINESNYPIAHYGIYMLQYKLNLVDDTIFPNLKYLSDENEQNSEILQRFNSFRRSQFAPGQTNLSLILRPLTKLGAYFPTPRAAYKESVIEEISQIDDLEEALDEYKKACAELNMDNSFYPNVIFLGTGSACPSKYRNTSCIVVKINDKTSFMLDCGEGSFGQFYRLFGKDAENELRKLKGIFVSHHHADHHLGLIEFLKKRETLNVDPLIAILPSAVGDWLKQYDYYEKISHLYKYYCSNDFRAPNSCKSLLKQLHLNSFVTVKVPHCRDSLGIVFKTNSQPSYKIVYSGDAMPSTNLIREGHDCDLLIHEGTMDDDMKEEAIMKRHSTISQAIDVGKQMNAKITLLTHFSQRYSKIPIIPEDAQNVGIAFDNMCISLSQLPKLPLLLKPLKTLFAENYDEMIFESEKRIARKQFLRKYV
ncbi:hypothetical protein B4U79_08996 [Dinothrombium tinctorium]|uniref:ribonuclease Z n=1 Tax=Dinothrombium tinctorium TaxID=1965070 RepID=A0A443RHX6_9ACAR|nr:hypothetical protein B4U79_08996 [Dinothrombium tinctorium]